MIQVTFEVDDVAVTAHLSTVDSVVFDAVAERVRVYTAMLENYVEEKKLQGQVLRHVTGKLSASIDHDFPKESDTEIQGRVFSNDTVKYAAIHEFGGVIHHPGGTAYIPGGGSPFDGAMLFISNLVAIDMEAAGHPLPRTAPHDIIMPERSFLRSSLRENAAKFQRGIELAALRAAALGTNHPIEESAE